MPRSSCFLAPVLPIGYNVPAKKSSFAPAAVSQTSAGIRGDYSIDSHGAVTSSELVYDHDTQLEPSADAEFLWDGQFDYSYYEEEVEFVGSSNIQWEDSGFDAAELESCSDAEVADYCYDAEVEDCGAIAEDYYEDYYYL